MKSYQSVLAEKSAQQTDVRSNSLHRSSLLFPVQPLRNSTAVLTLSNHFKIKRGIDAVGMRIWGFDASGHRLFSDHELLSEARVYRYDVGARALEHPELVTCQVEFYSAANLGMPYPAALVNHVGEGFHNVVHSFARALNDEFEDEEINAIRVSEASLDVQVDQERDTFVVFLTGPRGLTDGFVELSVRRPGGEMLVGRAAVNGNRFAATTILLSRIFPGEELPFGSVLKVTTPHQPMFFGRLIGGITSRLDGAFSANHSYYDHGAVPEYVEAPYGYNLYPLVSGLSTRLSFYPIQAPSRLMLDVDYFTHDGRSLGSGFRRTLDSPAGDAAVLDVSAQAPAEAAAFRITAYPEGGGTPSRISHQIVVGHRHALSGSINESLEYPSAQAYDAPAGRPFLSWIQGVHGPATRTRIGLTPMRHQQQAAARIDYVIYDESGAVRDGYLTVAPNGAVFLDSDVLFGAPSGSTRYFFVYTSCATSRIKMLAVIESRATGHCSAEHNF